MAHVLIYSGAGTSISSVRWTLTGLKDLLPLYDVHTIASAASLAQPAWKAGTALLVLPGGRDLPYQEQLSLPLGPGGTSANEQIKSYVQAGGRCLAICAGAYYASASCAFELHDPTLRVVGARPLNFFNGTCRGAVYPGFSYDDQTSTAARDVLLDSPLLTPGSPGWRVNHTGGGAFIQAETDPACTVLARYRSDDTDMWRPDGEESPYAGQAAAIECAVGQGKALLLGVHPERPLGTYPGAPPNTLELEQAEAQRKLVFGILLARLGLRVAGQLGTEQGDTIATPGTQPGQPPHLTPLALMHLDPPTYDWSGSGIISLGSGSPPRLNLPHDTFVLYQASSPSAGQDAVQAAAEEDYESYRSTITDGDIGEKGEVDLSRVPKHLVVYPWSTIYPNFKAFNPSAFTEHLRDVRDHLKAHSILPTPAIFDPWAQMEPAARLAPALIYGQVVTSTQTLLDRNLPLLRLVPPGLVAVATHQIAGRGRGGNSWISPRGCLQFSMVLSLPLSQAPSSVFVQYLAGLAIVLTVRHALGPEYAQQAAKVKIKWPNDVYTEVPDDAEGNGWTYSGKRYAKLAGILVNSQIVGQEMRLVVGCGVNVSNALPTTCLQNLSSAELSQERVLAGFIAVFEVLWTHFRRSASFDQALQALYRSAWLHDDQLVRLAPGTHPGHVNDEQVRIVGITSDFGLLRTVPLSSSVTSSSDSAWGSSSRGADGFVDLMPDGNSFDMLQGLLRPK